MSALYARAQLLERLRGVGARSEPWDVVVVGGGATGLGCAVDAAARGYSTLLLEAHDFAKGTSSRATKLIHGGVRYLAQGNLALVREGLAERSVLLGNAPHLVKPLRFVVPAYRWRDLPLLGAGLKFYDLLAGSHGLGPSRVLGVAHTLEALPGVRAAGLRGSIAYWDAQFDDARFAIALALTIFEHGGLALNYLPVSGLLKAGGRVCGVEAVDAESGECFEIRARSVINATGVWADQLRRMDLAEAATLIRPSQGVHVVVDADFLPGANALLVPHTEDGRVLFAIPWLGKLLIGTTDTPCNELPIEPVALDAEIDYLLATASGYLRRTPLRSELRSVFAGLRPLVGGSAPAGATRSLSREHLVEQSASGLVTIAGGKWTTYRRMASDAVDAACRVAALQETACTTRQLRLHGAHGSGARTADRGAIAGLADAPRQLHPRLTLCEGEVRRGARLELARGIEDILARRDRALFLDAEAAIEVAPEVGRLLAQELGHDAAWVEAEVARFVRLAIPYTGRAIAEVLAPLREQVVPSQKKGRA